MTAAGRATCIDLPRGGHYIMTSAGAVQVGMPPETIKDAMELGLDVPVLYVLPRELFDRHRGLSVAEFEFPTYYSFFLLKRKARLCVESAEVEARVRAIFQETLFGPAGAPRENEFADGYPEDARPDFKRESEYFRMAPGRSRLDVDDLVDFVRFEDGVARVSSDVHIELEAESFAIMDRGKLVAKIERSVRLPPRSVSVASSAGAFVPPQFGVTVLGASHGFDPKGKTTGFLLWIGGRALLVDPPTDSTEYLNVHGVAPKLIDGVILTHCHADHDAGTFQKLLEEGRVSLYTTPFILGSFLRKYSALSGLSEDILRRTFVFHPVRIGAPSHVRGGELWFRYTLHSIPAIGVEAFYGGRSIAISGDTLYDPARIQEMFDAGVLSRERYEDLAHFRGHHSVHLHEAGIPPLHTPTSALAELPPEVKKRILLVHIAEKDVPSGVGLVHAKVGLAHTLRVEATATPEYADAIALLDAVAMCDLMRDLPLSRARAILQVAQRLSLPAGEKIIEQGTRGDSFYILVNGVVSVVKDGNALKKYVAGDYFGEMALVLDKPRSADVVARTDVELIAIDKNDFLALLRGTRVAERLERIARVHEEGTWDLMEANSVLSRLSSGQKTQLQTYLAPYQAIAGETLWSVGERPRAAYIVGDAEIVLDGDASHGLTPFAAGAFVGDVDALVGAEAAQSGARVRAKGSLYRILRDDLARFFEENPGVHLSFLGARFVE